MSSSMDIREQETRNQLENLRNDNNTNNTNATNADNVVLARLEKLQRAQDGMMQLLSTLLPQTHQEAIADRIGLPDERGTNGSPVGI